MFVSDKTNRQDGRVFVSEMFRLLVSWIVFVVVGDAFRLALTEVTAKRGTVPSIAESVFDGSLWIDSASRMGNEIVRSVGGLVGQVTATNGHHNIYVPDTEHSVALGALELRTFSAAIQLDA